MGLFSFVFLMSRLTNTQSPILGFWDKPPSGGFLRSGECASDRITYKVQGGLRPGTCCAFAQGAPRLFRGR